MPCVLGEGTLWRPWNFVAWGIAACWQQYFSKTIGYYSNLVFL